MGIQWEEQWGTGVAGVDEQHKAIFCRFDELSAAIEAGGAQDAVEKLLHYLKDYADSHFADEEGLMLQLGYPGLEEQRAYHDAFRRNIEKLLEMLPADVPNKELAIRVDGLLVRYFINHIRKVDSKLGEFAKSHAVENA